MSFKKQATVYLHSISTVKSSFFVNYTKPRKLARSKLFVLNRQNATIQLTAKQKKLLKVSFYASGLLFKNKLKVSNLLKALYLYNVTKKSAIQELGLMFVPFTNQMNLVPGAHKIQKIQRLTQYNFSAYKVFIHGCVSFQSNTIFQSKKKLVHLLQNQLVTLTLEHGTVYTPIQQAEASYIINDLKSFGHLCKPKALLKRSLYGFNLIPTKFKPLFAMQTKLAEPFFQKVVNKFVLPGDFLIKI